MNHPKISAIIPAYNEANTIGSVLSTVVSSNLIDEIIVVNDGSGDLTSQKAADFGVLVINLPINGGKGYAMSKGLEVSTGEVIIFLDADLVGLQKKHLEELLIPVLTGLAEMTVGKFSSGSFWTTLSQNITPFLSGQRAIRKSALTDMKDFSETRFGVETALTMYFKKNNFRIQEVLLENLTHVVKEEKFGLFKGFIHRIRMYRDILKVVVLR
jgi:glycosyltransferase involved in cell wall biosynthesis